MYQKLSKLLSKLRDFRQGSNCLYNLRTGRTAATRYSTSRPQLAFIRSETKWFIIQNMRDNFSADVRNTIAARVNYRCCNPTCRAPTTGPQIDTSKSLNVGVAAHITAASPGGPRFDLSLTAAQRMNAQNAIWLCQTCGKLVDNDKLRFTERELRSWKEQAEAEALLRIGKAASSVDPIQADWSEEELILLSECAQDGEIAVLSSDETGKWIRAGRRDFDDQSDPAVAALYVDALNSLCKRDLAAHEGGILYKLTGKGFKIARALKKQQETVADEGERSLPAIPLDKASIFAYITGNKRVRELDKRIAEDAGIALNLQVDASFNLLEKTKYFAIENIAQLHELVKRFGDRAVLMSHYLRVREGMVAGISIEFVLDVMAAELGSTDAAAAYYDSLEFTSVEGRAWGTDVIHAYEQIKMYDS